MSHPITVAEDLSPAGAYPSPGSVLPPRYTPRVAGYARGPFLVPVEVTPSEWRWRNTRTAIVKAADGLNYRALRIHVGGEFVGWWAVELLGSLLPLNEWETEPE